MTGISWGGFNSLQLAARRPPALKAIVTLMSTDDRYADDVHYKGGCVMGTDLLHWSSCMLHWQCQPPQRGRRWAPGWRELWRRRLEANEPWVHTWLAHQRRDDYWKHGSVCEDYGAIEVPVYAVGGWADGYTNAVLRLLEGLRGPRKGLIGPWGHGFPHIAAPGPAIGFLQETLRWWDHWLKGARHRHHGRADAARLDAGVRRRRRARSPTSPGAGSRRSDWPSPRLDAATLAPGRRRRAARRRRRLARAIPRRPPRTARTPAAV